jgi:hypothetical protein
VSLPCSLEASADIGQPTRAGVLRVPIKDLEEAAKKAKEIAKLSAPPKV